MQSFLTFSIFVNKYVTFCKSSQCTPIRYCSLSVVSVYTCMITVTFILECFSQFVVSVYLYIVAMHCAVMFVLFPVLLKLGAGIHCHISHSLIWY